MQHVQVGPLGGSSQRERIIMVKGTFNKKGGV